MPRGMDSRFVFGKWDYNINNNQRLQLAFSFTRQVETTSWNFTLTTRSRWFQLHPDDYVVHRQVAGELGERPEAARDEDVVLPAALHRQQPGGDRTAAVQLHAQLHLADPQRLGAARQHHRRCQLRLRRPRELLQLRSLHAIYTSTIFTNKHSIKFGADWLYGEVRYELYSPLVGTYSFPRLRPIRPAATASTRSPSARRRCRAPTT